MLFGNIIHTRSYEAFIQNEAFLRALDWIRQMAPDSEAGIYQIDGKKMFVNVHGYETHPREECRFESHHDYVDLQYCIAGGEFIDYQLTSRLERDEGYDPERDLQFYEAPGSFSTLHMTPGDFAIFYQEDGHRPKVLDNVHPNVRKLVVKLSKEIL